VSRESYFIVYLLAQEKNIVSEKRMHKVEPKDYEQVRPIFAELAETHLNVTAVLDGNCPAKVYVDEITHPQTACIMTSGDACYLAGATHHHRFNAALNTLLPHDTYFALFCDPDRWESALDVVLKNTYAIRARRRFYTFKGLKVLDWQDRIPYGFAMQPIDAELLAKGLRNSEDVMEGILQEWGSVDKYLRNGFGLCLLHEDGIVSWSFSDYVSGDRCEIGICTEWNYRRRGFGTLTAAATAAYAAAHGFARIGWHCWDNNVGSIRVAENVGFEKRADYDIFINHWVAENITDMTPDEFRAFAESYEREFDAQPPTNGFPHIVAAKAWALGGEQSGCFRHLNKAVDVGWLRSPEQLRQIWPEFFSVEHLDQTKEWQELVSRLERADRRPGRK
jgi:RimJ/RimL family protein N-acetyltransferase